MKGLVPIIQEMVMTGGIMVTPRIDGITGTMPIAVMTITGTTAMEGMAMMMMMTGMTVMVITTRAGMVMAETIMAVTARIMEGMVKEDMAMVTTRL
jgi:hypothetical protein